MSVSRSPKHNQAVSSSETGGLYPTRGAGTTLFAMKTSTQILNEDQPMFDESKKSRPQSIPSLLTIVLALYMKF